MQPAGRFVAELLGMCAVMCVGGQVLSLAFLGVAKLLGYSNLAGQAPELSILVIAINLSIAMAAYMALRRHGWRHNLQMSAGSIAVGILMIGALWLGSLPQSFLRDWTSLFGLVCGPSCLVMVIMMLLSFDMYSGRAARHMTST